MSNQPDGLYVTNEFLVQGKEPAIRVTWGDQDGRLSLEAAEAHAMGVLTCVEAARQDHFLYDFFRQELESTEDQALHLLARFRAHRGGRAEHQIQVARLAASGERAG